MERQDGVKLYIFRFSCTRVGIRTYEYILLYTCGAADGCGPANNHRVVLILLYNINYNRYYAILYASCVCV